MGTNNDNADTHGKDPVLVVGRSGGVCESCGSGKEGGTFKTIDGKGRRYERCVRCARVRLV